MFVPFLEAVIARQTLIRPRMADGLMWKPRRQAEDFGVAELTVQDGTPASVAG